MRRSPDDRSRVIPRHRWSAVIGLAWLLLTPSVVAAASSTQSGWLAWFNSTRLADDWGLVSDVQYRVPEDDNVATNLLIRGGLSWNVAPRHTLGTGYAYIGTFAEGLPDATEHRTWQQWMPTLSLGNLSLAQRFRLEQRFIGRPESPDVYSDRLRWFVRTTLPMRTLMSFDRDAFLAVQNEIMFNLSNRDELNGASLDQNRAYVAVGWRISPRIDAEVGYLNQWINGRQRDAVVHVLQVALYSR